VNIGIALFKHIGIYSLICSLFSVATFIWCLFVWNRFNVILSLSFSNIGLMIALVAFFYDKKKRITLIATLLCLIPYMYLFLVSK
jgi:hypothetical protein